MFSVPSLREGEQFPLSPIDTPQFQHLVDVLGLDVNPDQPLLPQVTAHAVGWIEEDLSVPHPVRSRRFWEVPAYQALAQVGLVNAIRPQEQQPDFVITDGGTKQVYDYRLGYIENQHRKGGLATPHIGVFGGQRLRMPADDKAGKLEDIAHRIKGSVDPWAKDWLSEQVGKNPSHPSPWKRPFATEHEVAILALLQLYKGYLQFAHTIYRPTPLLHESIPQPTVAAQIFKLGRATTVYALNAPAIIREHVGRKHPISEARPTGRSCFFEWEAITRPPADSSVLLISHNPNIYRSWLDLWLGAREIGRSDLRISGAGPGIEPHRTFGYLLRGLGDIIMNFYNYEYEGGLNVPVAPGAPAIQPRHS